MTAAHAFVCALLLGACSRELPVPDDRVERAVSVAGQVDRDELKRMVEELVVERELDAQIVPPWDTKALSHLRSADYVVSQLENLGYEPVQEISFDDGLDVNNIWIEVPGTTDPDSLVLITAHYDAWFSGADDNATGTAVVLEAARVFRDNPMPLTVRMVAFDREEEGLIGSARYVEAHRADDVRAVINLDSVGYADHTPGSQKSLTGVQTPSTGDFLAVLGNSEALSFVESVAQLSTEIPSPVYVVGVIVDSAESPALGSLMRGDHARFWSERIPALTFTDTANFRNDHYHTEEDLVATLDFDFLEQVAQVTVAAAAAFAEGE